MNRKSVAASNSHNLNILERQDSIGLAAGEVVLQSTPCSSAHPHSSTGSNAVGASYFFELVRTIFVSENV